jgi:hypothetical protein
MKEHVDEFLNQVLLLCKRYNLSISHEDANGAFRIVPYSDDLAEWLREARIEMPPRPIDGVAIFN